MKFLILILIFFLITSCSSEKSEYPAYISSTLEGDNYTLNFDPMIKYNESPRPQETGVGFIVPYNCKLSEKELPFIQKMKEIEPSNDLFNTYIIYKNSYILIHKNTVVKDHKAYLSAINEEQKLKDLCQKDNDYPLGK